MVRPEGHLELLEADREQGLLQGGGLSACHRDAARRRPVEQVCPDRAQPLLESRRRGAISHAL
jgi:hypothetical protein